MVHDERFINQFNRLHDYYSMNVPTHAELDTFSLYIAFS